MPVVKHLKWKISKGWVIHVYGKKPLPYSEGRKWKLVRVLHRKGGATYGAQKLVPMNRMIVYLKSIKLKNSAVRDISGFLEERVGGKKYHMRTPPPPPPHAGNGVLKGKKVNWFIGGYTWCKINPNLG